jgi:ubiquinone/menaquinone biosynthesis C-methylase UbiE
MRDPSDDDASAEVIRLQAEEHPLIEDEPPKTPVDHCLRLMHLKAYEEAATYAVGRDVLDVGCNTGYGTVQMMGGARRVVGVDVSPRAIETARRRAQEGVPEFVVTEGRDLPFADASFDLVTSFQVLEHVPDAPALLGELRRVVRPGGTIILTTPNAAVRLYPGMQPWNRFHVREYLPAELEDLLRHQFTAVRIRGMFGTATLYETEIQRVDAARKRVARTEEKVRRAEARAARAAARKTRPLPVRVARSAVPGGTRAWLRRVRRQGAPVAAVPPTIQSAGPVMDFETYLHFSLADLFYADTDLDRAMDLMAVCAP